MASNNNEASDILEKASVVQIIKDYHDAPERLLTRLADSLPQLRQQGVVPIADKARHVKKVLATLSADQQVILALKYLEGLEFQTVATAIDKPLNTVKSARAKAVKLIFERLAVIVQEAAIIEENDRPLFVDEIIARADVPADMHDAFIQLELHHQKYLVLEDVLKLSRATSAALLNINLDQLRLGIFRARAAYEQEKSKQNGTWVASSKTEKITLSGKLSTDSPELARFNSLMKENERRIFGITYRYFNEPNNAEEAMRHAFTIAWQSFQTYNDEEPFIDWMRPSIKASCREISRLQDRRLWSLDATLDGKKDSALYDQLPSPTPSPEQIVVEANTSHKAIKSALNSLPPFSRLLVILVDIEQISCERISNMFGLPVTKLIEFLDYAREEIRIYLENKSFVSTVENTLDLEILPQLVNSDVLLSRLKELPGTKSIISFNILNEMMEARGWPKDLRCAVQSLPSHYREPLVLVDMLGFSIQDAATKLDAKPVMVKKRINYVRRLLPNYKPPKRFGKKIIHSSEKVNFTEIMALMDERTWPQNLKYAVMRLLPHQQVLLKLKYFDCLRTKQIGQKLNISYYAVQARLEDIQKALVDHLENIRDEKEVVSSTPKLHRRTSRHGRAVLYAPPAPSVVTLSAARSPEPAPVG